MQHCYMKKTMELSLADCQSIEFFFLLSFCFIYTKKFEAHVMDVYLRLLGLHRIVLPKAYGIARSSNQFVHRRLFINKIYKFQMFNLYFKNGYASIFSFEEIWTGFGKKCLQSLKNSSSMMLNAVLPLSADFQLSECFLQQPNLRLEYRFVFQHTALENKTYN